VFETNQEASATLLYKCWLPGNTTFSAQFKIRFLYHEEGYRIFFCINIIAPEERCFNNGDISFLEVLENRNQRFFLVLRIQILFADPDHTFQFDKNPDPEPPLKFKVHMLSFSSRKVPGFELASYFLNA
jgi:hypothetical protein